MNGIVIVIIFFCVILSIGALVGLAFIPASIAKKKGYGFAGFFLFSLIGFFPAFIVALCLNDRNAEMMKIREIINDAADEIKDIK